MSALLISGGESASVQTLERVQAAIMGASQSPVRSLLLKGTIKRGFNGVTGLPSNQELPLEMRLRLPDSFLTVIEARGVQTRMGFVGNKQIFALEVIGKGSTGGGSPPGNSRQTQEEFSRVALLLLAHGATPFKLDVIETRSTAQTVYLKGETGEIAMDLEPSTSLPIRVRYRGTAGLPQRALTKEEIESGVMLPLRLVTGEISLSAGDRRLIHGVSLPYRLTATLNGARIEEMTFKEVLVNPILGPDAFRN